MNEFEDLSDYDEQDPDWVSKSQRKRDDAALQDLAAELVELSAEQLLSLALEDDLLAAVQMARTLENKRGALKRQIKYVGGLLRKTDVTPIREQLDAFSSRNAQATARLHRLEQWRERLIEEGDEALAELLADAPDLDRQQLRQLVRNARDEKNRGRPPKAYRALFQLLRDSLPE